MNLNQFDRLDPIFVDANIFCFSFSNHPEYGWGCTNFLERIEFGTICAITSDIVLNEVFDIEGVSKGCQILNTTKRWDVRRQFDRDPGFAQACYQHIQTIAAYIALLETTGLTIVSPGRNGLFRSVQIGARQLWTRDAIHAATCQSHGVFHIATRDQHFDSVGFLKRWSPEFEGNDESLDSVGQ